MTLKDYLQSKYQSSSVSTYSRSIEHYLLAVPDAENANYSRILAYLQSQRNNQSSSSVHNLLQGIKKYYNYLQASGKRADNPAQSIHLKDYKSKQPILLNELLSREELEKAWTYFKDKRYKKVGLRTRNLGLLSMLLMQGLEAREVKNLELSDLDLLSGKVYIKSSSTRNARTLPLAAHQILLLYTYVEKDRPKLQANQALIPELFIGEKGKLDSIDYILRMPKRILGGKRLSSRLIRKSVLANAFKEGKSLAAVQYLAGHRCPSSTERYQIQDLEALQAGILKHHPLARGKKGVKKL